MKKKVTNGASIRTTDYLDGFQYSQLLLEFFPHAEGYVKATNTGFTPGNPNYAFNYVYNYTDHLGNVRLSYAKDPQTGNLKILDESHYYPFGLKHQEYQANGFTTNPIQGIIIAPVANNPFKYKYNGKEFQDELGLSLYDYGARNYEPALGRWMNMDPLAEEFYSLSPYNYVANDPVGLADLDGRDFRIDIRRNEEGDITMILFSATVYIKGDGASEERASQLSEEFMSKFGGLKDVEGVKIGVGVTYVYNEEANEKNLRAGENILNFSSLPEDGKEEHRSKVFSYKLNNVKYTGNTGIIFGSGKTSNTVFHETFHFLGLSDRYDDHSEDKWRPVEAQTTVPHKDFENDIMGNSHHPNVILKDFRYKQWYNHALKRSKGRGNKFGSEFIESNKFIDRDSGGKLKTP